MSDQITAKDIIEKDILELIGGEFLDDDQKEKLYRKMLETINFRVLDRIDEQLDDEGVSVWMALVWQGDGKKIGGFFKEKGIDVEQIAQDEALKYKSELIAYITYQKKAGRTLDEVQAMIGGTGEANKRSGDNA